MYELIRSPIATIDIISTISGGGGGSTTYTAGAIVPTFVSTETPGTYNIAAGAYKVSVYNAGTEDLTVNGDTLAAGERWEMEYGINKVDSKQDYCPAVEIVVPTDGAVTYSAWFPSA